MVKKVNRKSNLVKKSRKPSRKKSRKPKKASRKPRKKSRKPRKKSRKPKKASRKPRKKSRRTYKAKTTLPRAALSTKAAADYKKTLKKGKPWLSQTYKARGVLQYVFYNDNFTLEQKKNPLELLTLKFESLLRNEYKNVKYKMKSDKRWMKEDQGSRIMIRFILELQKNNSWVYPDTAILLEIDFYPDTFRGSLEEVAVKFPNSEMFEEVKVIPNSEQIRTKAKNLAKSIYHYEKK